MASFATAGFSTSAFSPTAFFLGVSVEPAFSDSGFDRGAFSDESFSFGDGTLSVGVDHAEFSIAGQSIVLVKSGSSVQPSGGFFAYDRQLAKRRREEDERRELADRLEAVMLAEGSITKPDADLIRLKALASQYESLPNKVNRAVLYAERVRTEQALNLALREMQRLQDEEIEAIVIALALDD